MVSKVMKIALLGAYPVAFFAKQLGIRKPPQNSTSWNVNLANGLAAIPGNEVHFFTVVSGLKEDHIIHSNRVFIHFLAAPHKSRFLTLFQYNKIKIHRELAKIRPDIVHAHGTEHEYPYIAVTTEFPCVITIHCVLSDIMGQTGLGLFNRMRVFYLLEKYVLSKAKFIIGTTEYMKSSLKNYKANFYAIENSVNHLFFNDSNRPKNEKAFLFVGRISPEKGIETLLDATDRLKTKGMRPSINILGVPSDKKYSRLIERKIRSAKLELEIMFRGIVSQDKVASYMAGSVALILPSRYDAFGLVLAEAMATGTPVIASRVGGIPYVVDDGKTGLLFEPGDVVALAEKMMLLMKDKDLRRLMGQHGKQEAMKRFHPDVVARKTMEVYEKVIADWER